MAGVLITCKLFRIHPQLMEDVALSMLPQEPEELDLAQFLISYLKANNKPMDQVYWIPGAAYNRH